MFQRKDLEFRNKMVLASVSDNGEYHERLSFEQPRENYNWSDTQLVFPWSFRVIERREARIECWVTRNHESHKNRRVLRCIFVSPYKLTHICISIHIYIYINVYCKASNIVTHKRLPRALGPFYLKFLLLISFLVFFDAIREGKMGTNIVAKKSSCIV